MKYYVKWWNNSATVSVQKVFDTFIKRDQFIDTLPCGVVIETWETTIARATRCDKSVDEMMQFVSAEVSAVRGKLSQISDDTDLRRIARRLDRIERYAQWAVEDVKNGKPSSFSNDFTLEAECIRDINKHIREDVHFDITAMLNNITDFLHPWVERKCFPTKEIIGYVKGKPFYRMMVI